MPVHIYTNWNSRPYDNLEQIEPFKKFYFICEGLNTETYYFRRLIDLRKQLGIHQLIELCLCEKTGKDKDISFPKNLKAFADEQKKKTEIGFDPHRDKMIIVFDGDIFENKVSGYDELVSSIEENDIAAVTNPGFELFLILHIEGSYYTHIQGHEAKFLSMDKHGKYSHAYNVLRDLTHMNAKKNPEIGKLADNVLTAINQETNINQDIHQLKGQITSNIGKVIKMIINDNPDIN